MTEVVSYEHRDVFPINNTMTELQLKRSLLLALGKAHN